PGRGYRFVADVREVVEQEKVSPESIDVRPVVSAAVDSQTEIPESAAASVMADPADSAPAFLNGRRQLLAAAAVAIAVAGLTALLFVRYWRLPSGVRDANSPAPAIKALSSPAQIPEKSIAVLPFENRSHDVDNAYFADAIQDE